MTPTAILTSQNWHVVVVNPGDVLAGIGAAVAFIALSVVLILWRASKRIRQK